MSDETELASIPLKPRMMLVGTPEAEAAAAGAAEASGLAEASSVADDLDVAVGLLGELAGTPKDAIQPGRRITTLRTRELGMSVRTALITPHVRSR